jgi:diguanylate cyclase (GGDEF)-like protein
VSELSTFSRAGRSGPLARLFQAVRERGLLIAIGISAVLLFVGTTGSLLPRLLRTGFGLAEQPDVFLTNAVLLNIAVILLGWNHFRSMNRELDQRRNSEMEARRLAERDALTGCFNRHSLSDMVNNLVTQADEQGKSLAVMLLDLDNFKLINDLNGHGAGDEVLKIVAQRIQDTLPADAVMARLGGDEFACAVMFPSDNPGSAEHIVSLVIEKAAQPIQCGEHALNVTVSIGIANNSDIAHESSGQEDSNPPIQNFENDRAQVLLHKADIAMYHAKKQGKNRFFWFESEMEQELHFRNNLETGIREGIKRGEFVPYYEQLIDLSSDQIVGFEMLARWNSPEMGLVGPDVFIPVAEEIGVIAELSEQLICQALEDAKNWDKSLTLSVNISPIQMRDPWFSHKLVKLLVEHNFPPSRLEIEITESCLHENTTMVRSMITSLRNQGIKISLDDFGTGYASLTQLRTLPFDRLKIDRSFIQELEREGASEKLVDAIISMGNGLDMPITAEGIENPEALEILKSMGQMKGQGYHYGKPEPAEEVHQRLCKRGLLAKEASGSDIGGGIATGPRPLSASQKHAETAPGKSNKTA